MQRRRWLQFSLRFLFAALLASACLAWWFRPGIVKPEFSVEAFSPDDGAPVGTERMAARIRLTNVGPDSVWLDESAFQYQWDTRGGRKGKVDEDEWQTIGGGGGSTFSSRSQRIRLKPGKSHVFVVPLEYDAGTIAIGVDIADRRGRGEKTYWSQHFAVPDNLIISSPEKRQ